MEFLKRVWKHLKDWSQSLTWSEEVEKLALERDKLTAKVYKLEKKLKEQNKEIERLNKELEVVTTNEETYRLEMLDITKILGLDEFALFDDVKDKAKERKVKNERRKV